MPAGTWYKEWLTPHESHSHRLRRTVLRARTKFQRAVIADTYSFGRCLLLDGELQSAQSDEFIYHESLVHPAMIAHPAPQNILILGGGEGATARELLKHTTVKRVTMVDIDGDVVEFCRKHLPSWHQGAFDDPRVRLVIDDAKAFVENSAEKFDVIVSDLPSPAEGGPVHELYTVDFYRRLAARLKAGGVFVLQSGSGSPLQLELHQVLYSTLRKIFKIVRPYYAYVPSFDVPWAFLCASNTQDPLRLDQTQVGGRMRKRMRGRPSFYDGMTHVGLFHIPRHVRTKLEREKRLMTKSRPIYFYK